MERGFKTPPILYKQLCKNFYHFFFFSLGSFSLFSFFFFQKMKFRGSDSGAKKILMHRKNWISADAKGQWTQPPSSLVHFLNSFWLDCFSWTNFEVFRGFF